MENSRFLIKPMSPCLRIFFESIIDEADRNLSVNDTNAELARSLLSDANPAVEMVTIRQYQTSGLD
jgi:hypothetical protein